MIDAVRWLAIAGICLPVALVFLLGVPLLLERRLPERVVGGLTGVLTALSAGAFGSALVLALAGSVRRFDVSAGAWFGGPEPHIAVDLLIDPMSLAFGAVSAIICGTVVGFSHRYLHREVGYHRYFVLFSIFLAGMLAVVFAGSVEVLFVGWELLGISSTLLVCFFHERPAPVRNALRVFVVYRMSDAAMLGAAVLVHHLSGSSSLALLFGGGVPDGSFPLSDAGAMAVGLLLAVAVAGKCAQLPFSFWLPRAMEGPTPSSAVYYGALSVHAGAYLLLRAAPILEHSPVVAALVGAMGGATAIYAAFARRVQTDVKSALAFASLTHVSLILVEIAAGWHRLAFLHLLANASLRLLQFLRAPSVLHDFHEARDAVGAAAARHRPDDGRPPGAVASWAYRFALERGYLEDVVEWVVVTPFLRAVGALERVERRVADGIAGSAAPPAPGRFGRGRRETIRD